VSPSTSDPISDRLTPETRKAYDEADANTLLGDRNRVLQGSTIVTGFGSVVTDKTKGALNPVDDVRKLLDQATDEKPPKPG
jgi:hypothetical protein